MVFSKFDADKDGKLDKKEVEAYMKATINFDLPPDVLDGIAALDAFNLVFQDGTVLTSLHNLSKLVLISERSNTIAGLIKVSKLNPITFAKFKSLHQRLYIAKSELLAREAVIMIAKLV